MAVELSKAQESDADRIAAVHMAAFGSNALLQAQFPTAAIREQLVKCIAQKAIDDIRDPKTAVLVVRHQNEIISFAKWSRPVLESEAHVEPPWQWPEGTNYAMLDPWSERVEAAKQKVLGDMPHYHLTFIGTDPLYERRGAASLLIQWGLEHCKRDNVPAYLESTAKAGLLYERHGFQVTENIFMELEGIRGDAPVIYEERCFLFEPSKTSLRGNKEHILQHDDHSRNEMSAGNDRFISFLN